MSGVVAKAEEIAASDPDHYVLPHHLPPPLDQGGQFLGFLVFPGAGFRADRLAEARQYLRIQRVGFSQPPEGLAEIPGLAGIDHRRRQVRFHQRPHHRGLQTTGGFQHDQGRRPGAQPARQFRQPGWFQLDPETRTELRLRSSAAYQGEPLRPLGWIVHRHQAKSGYLARAGLARILAWPYLFKNYAVRDLAELLELHGLPLRLATYPAFLSETDKNTLWSQLRDLGRNAAALLPEGVQIEFAEIQSKGEPYQAMIDWCERSISKAILGQTLSAESKATGLGSGVASLHDEVRWDLISSDARQIAGTLTTQLIVPLLRLNRGPDDPVRWPRFAFDLKEVADLSQYAEALPKLVTIGLPIPVAWASERLGIPAPAEGEPTLTAAPAPAPGEPVPARLGVAPLSAAAPSVPPVAAPDLDREAALAAREAALAQAEAERARTEATAYAEAQLAAGKLLPRQRNGLIELLLALPAAPLAFAEGEQTVEIAPRAWLERFLADLPVRVEYAERSAAV